MGRDAPPHLFYEREIRGPVLAGGSPDRNENRQAGFHSLSEIGGEGQPPFRQPFADQFGQSRFVKGISPLSRWAIRPLAVSMAPNVTPNLAKPAPVTHPTAPGPSPVNVIPPPPPRV